jgi:hypothetical protein
MFITGQRNPRPRSDLIGTLASVDRAIGLAMPAASMDEILSAECGGVVSNDEGEDGDERSESDVLVLGSIGHSLTGKQY